MASGMHMALHCHLCLVQVWILNYINTAVGAVKVTVSSPSVQVTRGSSVLLPCAFRTTAAINRLNIIWTVSPLRKPQHPLQVISYERGQIVESLSEYLGRVRFAFQPTKDASIFINETRSTDTGTYQCTVINPPDRATPNIGLIGLTVLIPPSRPECSSEGQEQEGGYIRLRCSVREGVPTPRFTWEKIPPENQVLITSQEDLYGFAILGNLTSGTSGLYRCTVANQLGSQSCAVELHVQEAVLGTLGIVVGITITLIMALVLLALFALVLCLHQQSQGKCQEEKYETYKQVRVDSPHTEKNAVTKSPHFSTAVSSKSVKPLWVLSSQTIKPCSHVLFDVRQSQVSITSALEASGFRSSRDTTDSEQEDYSVSEDEDAWGHNHDDTSPEPTTIRKESVYSANSGFLV